MEQGAVAAEEGQAKAETAQAPDEAVLVQAAQRDPAAFTLLYQRYVTPVYRYLYSRTGNAADAQDLTAQVFLEALQGLPRYRHRGHFAAWLFTIARRRATDHDRRRPVLLPWDDALIPTGEDDPLSQAVHSETLNQLHVLVAELGEDEAELLRLRYAAGLSFAQIAATLGLREGAMKMRLRRLLARLQAALGGER